MLPPPTCASCLSTLNRRDSSSSGASYVWPSSYSTQKQQAQQLAASGFCRCDVRVYLKHQPSGQAAAQTGAAAGDDAGLMATKHSKSCCRSTGMSGGSWQCFKQYQQQEEQSVHEVNK